MSAIVMLVNIWLALVAITAVAVTTILAIYLILKVLRYLPGFLALMLLILIGMIAAVGVPIGLLVGIGELIGAQSSGLGFILFLVMCIPLGVVYSRRILSPAKGWLIANRWIVPERNRGW